MKKNFVFSGLVLALLALAPSFARADDAKLIGTYGDWSAYVFTEGGNKVCYMASQPKKAEGKYSSRGEVFALVTHRPAEGSKNVFSYIAGYSYKEGSEATVTIDGGTTSLFTQKDTAWAADGVTDTKLAEGITKGSKMVVKGTSGRGTATTDTFSLKGTGSAYEAIGKECGI